MKEQEYIRAQNIAYLHAARSALGEVDTETGGEFSAEQRATLSVAVRAVTTAHLNALDAMAADDGKTPARNLVVSDTVTARVDFHSVAIEFGDEGTTGWLENQKECRRLGEWLLECAAFSEVPE
ncbi:hypothetical protein K0U83_23435 [bacterium]|nr:hypothetical protein [bacterium]